MALRALSGSPFSAASLMHSNPPSTSPPKVASDKPVSTEVCARPDMNPHPTPLPPLASTPAASNDGVSTIVPLAAPAVASPTKKMGAEGWVGRMWVWLRLLSCGFSQEDVEQTQAAEATAGVLPEAAKRVPEEQYAAYWRFYMLDVLGLKGACSAMGEQGGAGNVIDI